MKPAIFLSVALALSACATVPTAAGPTASVATIPSAPLNLGDWRGANAARTAQGFEHEVAARYAAGLPLTAVSSDLRRNDFTCTSSVDAGRGDPPDQICRKTVSVEGCTHTWQVHMFDASGNGALGRSRALYDRRCGGDGLLGGPG
jgi:hypothetical protein